MQEAFFLKNDMMNLKDEIIKVFFQKLNMKSFYLLKKIKKKIKKIYKHKKNEYSFEIL